MIRWRLKSCPRCSGDIFVERDLYGWFEQCIQCGYNHDLKDMGQVKELNYVERARVSKVATLNREW